VGEPAQKLVLVALNSCLKPRGKKERVCRLPRRDKEKEKETKKKRLGTAWGLRVLEDAPDRGFLKGKR